MRTWIAVLAVLLVCGAGQAEQRVKREWSEGINESSDALKRGDYARSLKLSKHIIGEMVELLGPGRHASQAFGLVLTHRALAHAGLGQSEDALWYWHVVIALYPAFERSDLSAFGEAGRFLKEHLPSTSPALLARPEGRFEQPRLVKKVNPEFPPGALYFGVEGVVRVQVIITTAGKPTSPQILDSLPAPTSAYAVLEAVKQWKFVPASVDGKPIDLAFTLVVNFKGNW